MDMRKHFAQLNDMKKVIKSICPEIQNKSGIYLFYRINEDNEKCFYVGQSKNVWVRCADHILWEKGKTQHIDKSLYVHKLFNENNPYGWRLKVIKYCDKSQLDLAEQFYIDYYNSKGFRSYNVTGGGQLDKKSDIGQRIQTKLKSHKNGKIMGYEKAREEVKVFFDKYLDYSIKGKPTKIKERKLAEFQDFLNKKEESGE